MRRSVLRAGLTLLSATLLAFTCYGGFDDPPAFRATGATATKTPALLGVKGRQAKVSLRNVSLIPRFYLGSPAPSAEKALTVYDQDPPAGAPLTPGQTVRLLIYGEHDANAVETAPVLPELAQVHSQPFLDKSDELIDPRSGRVSVSVTDMLVPAGRLKLELRRTLVPPGQPGLVGSGWRLNWERRLTKRDTQVAIEDGLARVVMTRGNRAGEFRSEGGDELRFEGDRAIWLRADGIRDTFDRQGQLIESDERNGNIIRLTYGAAGKLSRVEGPGGSSLQFSLDESGRVIRVESSLGDVVHYGYAAAGKNPAAPARDLPTRTYTYDQRGLLAKIEHPRNGATGFDYDAVGRIRSRRWSDGAAEMYVYDDTTRTLRYTDPAGQLTTTTWSEDGRFAKATSPLGHSTTVEYDKAGRTVAITGPTGQTLRMTYDALGRNTLVENPAKGTTRFEYIGNTTQLSAIVGPGEKRQSFEYDSEGNLRQLSDALDSTQSATFTYFPNGQPHTVVYGNGRKQVFSYDDAGRIAGIADAAGNTHRYEYDDRGNPVRETDPVGAVTTRTYDVQNRITSVTDPTNATTRFAYEQRGRFYNVTQTDARGGVTRSTYDQRGRLITLKNAAGGTTRYQYDVAGRVASLTDPAGQTTQYEYDAAGQLIGTTNPLGGVTRNTYDALGNLASVTEPTGISVRYQCTPLGHLAKSTDAAGRVTVYEYDHQGHLVARTDPDQRTVQYEYDAAGRLIKMIPPSGPIVSYEYDERGNLASVRRGDMTIVRYESDALGRRVKESNAAGLEITYRYDQAGRVIASHDNQGGGETIERDPTGRAVAVKDSFGNTSRMTYDPAGNLLSNTDPLGSSENRSYDALDRLVEVTAPTGENTRYRYDDAGRLAVVHHPGGGESDYHYNALGNLVGKIFPGGTESRATFDSGGRPLTTIDAKGQTTQFVYDDAGRVQEKRFADGKSIRWQYDNLGRIIRVDDGAFPVVYGYDEHGKVVRIQYPAIKRTLAWEFDDAGLKTKFVDSEGRVVRYEYDAFERLIAIRPADGAPVKFAYDSKGRVSSRTWPNGVKGEWQYDVADRPVRMTYTSAAGNSLGSWSYKYDAAGNRTETVDADGKALRHRYDPLRQLIEEATGTEKPVQYAYLPGGNRGKRAGPVGNVEYRYNQADQLLSAGNEAFRYDPNGNLIERKGANGAITTYTYDAQDRLTSVKLASGEEIQYRYAPTGERISRTDAKGTIYYVTDGTNLLAELDAALKPRAIYIHGPSIDQPLLMSRDGETSSFHADQLGSIARLTDASGAVIANYEYDAFGQPRNDTNISASPFTYTAREYDGAAQLYYYRARYYDARNGRFLSTDSATPRLTQPITLNPYVYAFNDPVRLVDPLGTDGFDPTTFNSATSAWHGIGWDNDGLYRNMQGKQELLAAGKEQFPGQAKVLAKDVNDIKGELLRRGAPLEPPPPPPPPQQRVPGPGARVVGPRGGDTLAVGAPKAPPVNTVPVEPVPPAVEPVPPPVEPMPIPLGGGRVIAPPSAGVVKAVGGAGAAVLATNLGLDLAEGKPLAQIGKELGNGAYEGGKWLAAGASVGAAIGSVVGGVAGGVAGGAAGGVGALPGAAAGAEVGAWAGAAWGTTVVGAVGTALALPGTVKRVIEDVKAAFPDSPVEPGERLKKRDQWIELPPLSPEEIAASKSGGWVDLPPDPAIAAKALPPPNSDDEYAARAAKAARGVNVSERAANAENTLRRKEAAAAAAAGSSPGYGGSSGSSGISDAEAIINIINAFGGGQSSGHPPAQGGGMSRHPRQR